MFLLFKISLIRYGTMGHRESLGAFKEMSCMYQVLDINWLFDAYSFSGDMNIIHYVF